MDAVPAVKLYVTAWAGAAFALRVLKTCSNQEIKHRDLEHKRACIAGFIGGVGTSRKRGVVDD